MFHHFNGGKCVQQGKKGDNRIEIAAVCLSSLYYKAYLVIPKQIIVSISNSTEAVMLPFRAVGGSEREVRINKRTLLHPGGEAEPITHSHVEILGNRTSPGCDNYPPRRVMCGLSKRPKLRIWIKMQQFPQAGKLGKTLQDSAKRGRG